MRPLSDLTAITLRLAANALGAAKQEANAIVSQAEAQYADAFAQVCQHHGLDPQRTTLGRHEGRVVLVEVKAAEPCNHKAQGAGGDEGQNDTGAEGQGERATAQIQENRQGKGD